MKILYTQPIFLPDDEILEKNIQSIKSFKNVLDNSPTIDIDIELGGWSINDEYWNIFIKRLNALGFKNLTVHRFDKNYGKAYVVNRLTTNMSEYDFLLTADSDIIFKDTANFIERLIEISIKSVELIGKPFGVMGINQEISNCHLIEYLSKHQREFKGYNDTDEKIIWNNVPSGIAGGCLFISSENWIRTGGYKEMGVYSGDDAILLLDTNKKGNSFFLCETISVIHPPENNQQYQKWKVKVCQRDTNGKNTKDLGKYIDESIEFWNGEME